MASGRQRLGDHLASLDAARFTGRDRVLAWIEGLLTSPDAPTRVVLVHGPGGIGKSALLREVGRRAQARDRPVWSLDARALDPVPGELERLLADAADRPGAVVLVDSFERIPAQDSLLRERVLPGLAADAIVVVAGRQPPSRAWFRHGWEHVSADVPLGPLGTGEARGLLAALGVTDPAVAGPLVDWAGGSPLALNLAASIGDRSDILDLAGVDLNHLILRRLAGDELGEVDGDVVEVAAVARAVDARLLAAVLPGRPTRAANEALRRSSVAELVGSRVTLHDLVRTALREDLRRRDPGRYGDLRCRVADHLHARAASGEPRLLSDLVELVDDPEVRWGIGGDPTRFRIDPWRPGEADDLVEAYVARKDGDTRWWDDLAPLLAYAPEMGLVARDLAGEPAGFCVATAAARAPEVAERDPHLAPVLADARARGAERALVFRESFGVAGEAAAMAAGTLHLSAVLRSGLPNVDRSYILDSAVDPSSTAFFRAVGAVHDSALDTDVDGRRVEVWVIDHGPGGMLGQVRDVIRAESGAASHGEGVRRDEDLHRAALDALRDVTRPGALTGNPLVDLVGPDGAGVDGSAALAAAVHAAVDAAFGPGPEDELLRRAVELADLDPSVNHDQAMARLAVSRATYFRHLRQARQRVAATLVERLHDDHLSP
jgi:hypothetical protein